MVRSSWFGKGGSGKLTRPPTIPECTAAMTRNRNQATLLHAGKGGREVERVGWE